jgi:hypothetical protein
MHEICLTPPKPRCTKPNLMSVLTMKVEVAKWCAASARPMVNERKLHVTTPARRPRNGAVLYIAGPDVNMKTDVALIARAARGRPSGICVRCVCREAPAAWCAASAAGCTAEFVCLLLRLS